MSLNTIFHELFKVRIRDSKYGLSEESHIHLNLDELNQNSFYEIMIAISIGLGVVVLLLLGELSEPYLGIFWPQIKGPDQ